ncbi:hypothetical protein EDB81DRAFT_843904 [Dactylonectria macrodidyma]|uniref:Aminoglycoside phosphotransferase domain-containing protein n=1 Tax=Dactylonectria macrodidyma TaxID=307937 RepID=A0A9P9EN69_9HYPO|nr:hypothetical protein EDB81DRAFT_843904 [Dactylonectria macrodidyma]
MSHIPGLSLYDVWFGQHLRGVDPETLRAHRTRALDDIAAAMAQLERYSFNSSGSVRFDPDGRPTGLGSNRVLDSQAMIDRWWIRKDPCEDLLYVEQPPTTDVGAFYTFTMDHRELSPSYGKGAELLLRQMISWIPEPASLKPFVLAHPDFNFNNFIVSEDGQLMGVIDWDGVSAMPRSIGNESYPSWLTRDWDPMMYAYNESMDAGVEPLGVWEDSPDTLKHYRSVYCQFMAKACGEGSHSQEITRRSLIADNLIIAADDSQVRLNILVKIAGESFGDPDDEGFFRSMDLIHGLADDEIDESEMAKLKEGFMRLLDEAL